MDNYSMMITSKYFETIEDFINLEMAVKRFDGSMERFHFNPIRLNHKTRKLFSNLETLHLYDECDEVFDDGRIFRNQIWFVVGYERYLEEKEKGNVCKLVCSKKEDRDKYGNEIPKDVKILEDGCFGYCGKLLSIEIPDSVTQIGDCCFEDCISLTSITIPSTVSKIGSSFFQLPFTSTNRNLTISSQIEEEIFYNCTSLTIPDSLEEYGKECFCKCPDLTLTQHL